MKMVLDTVTMDTWICQILNHGNIMDTPSQLQQCYLNRMSHTFASQDGGIKESRSTDINSTYTYYLVTLLCIKVLLFSQTSSQP